MASMGYHCAQCGSSGPFSANQKTKGANRRCNYCVTGGASMVFECRDCLRTFRDENALGQHAATHRPRSFPCPGCGKLYRGLTDTASHFESGSCTACLGEGNARRAAYDLVAGQSGGRSFLANAPLMLEDGSGSGGGGYSYDGPNFKCAACGKFFTKLASLMQHTENRPACKSQGRHPNLRIGPPQGVSYHEPKAQTFKFFHGTSWENALSIERNGFIPSDDGCLGPGVYVAREDKAVGFAIKRAEEEDDQYGGLVELLVTIRNPKYTVYNDFHWQDEGYDACRAERTSASRSIEWCVKDANQIEVVRISKVYV